MSTTNGQWGSLERKSPHLALGGTVGAVWKLATTLSVNYATRVNAANAGRVVQTTGRVLRHLQVPNLIQPPLSVDRGGFSWKQDGSSSKETGACRGPLLGSSALILLSPSTPHCALGTEATRRMLTLENVENASSLSSRHGPIAVRSAAVGRAFEHALETRLCIATGVYMIFYNNASNMGISRIKCARNLTSDPRENPVYHSSKVSIWRPRRRGPHPRCLPSCRSSH